MPLSDRDYARGKHPATCTCKECTEKRLARIGRSENKLRFLRNHKTPGKSDAVTPSSSPADSQKKPDNHKTGKIIPTKDSKKPIQYNIPRWLIALLSIFTLSLIGLGISLHVGIYIPFWILLGFSLIFSVEYWFYYQTRKQVYISRL
ncbi:hypothetical protein ACFLUF_03110 [Chloroflexota bacterium]